MINPLDEVPPPKKKRKQKPYVPARRTGPYAILIALSSLNEDSIQSLSKDQVIYLAREHCDSSFTDPDKGSHYTAWSSMRTLIDKDLVHERGRPRRNYALSEEGWDVARRIRSFEKGQTMLADVVQPERSATVTANGRRSPHEDDEEPFVSIDDLNQGPARQEVEQVKQKKPNQRGLMKKASGRPLGEAPADMFGLKDKSTTTSKSKSKSSSEVVEVLSSPEPEARPSKTNGADKVLRIPKSIRPPSTRTPPSISGISRATASRSASLVPDAGAEMQSKSRLPTFEPIIIPAGAFEVRLVLDNREIRSKESRDAITDGLSDLGTPVISRALSAGDAIWVARLRDEDFLSSHQEQGREIALDWIVERKRRDDLVGSIKDGRFHEQKFRLRRSGVKNVIYLLEQYNLSSENEDAFGEKIDGAIVSMQVVNDFFVKRTLGNEDTIRYLSQMTKYLKEEYESKPLYVIPSSILAPSTYLPLLEYLRSDPAHKERSYTITMPSFESLASKSDTLTLRDVFLKMLMCTKGLTGDKAIAIQKTWPTPSALLEAYEKCEDQQERELMVEKSLGRLVGRGSVKSALSTKISRIWAQG